jgi:sigma-B regulation protein RsbU (phosphoserine phosphatase)
MDDTKAAGSTLREENERLKRAVEELSVLNELARTIGASSNPEEIMQTIVRRSLRAVNAEQGVITLVEQHSADPMRTVVRAVVSSSAHEQFHLTQALLGWMSLNRKPLLLNTPRTDERFRGVQWDESIRSLVCVPMMIKSELRGVLTLTNKKEGKQFSDEDQRLLAIIAAQSAQVLENARLNEREKQLLKMQEEVRLAARIQAELLPRAAPVVEGYEIVGVNIPAQVVGGDHYDFIPIDSHRLAICLGDVSGKGLPASLLMANLQATLRCQTLSSPSPKECVRHTNTLLFKSTSPEKFATLFYCILDPHKHQLSFTNAGHEFPLRVSRDGTVQQLEAGGIVVGMLDEFPFVEETVVLQEDDVVVMCSDGITEAMNTTHEQFGAERFAETIRNHRSGSAQELIAAIIDAVKSHAGTAPQMDDMTLVAIKRTSA